MSSTEVPANVCVIGVTPIIAASIVMAMSKAMAQINIGGQDLFPEAARFYREASSNPYGIMELERRTNLGILLAVTIMVPAPALPIRPPTSDSPFLAMDSPPCPCTKILFLSTRVPDVDPLPPPPHHGPLCGPGASHTFQPPFLCFGGLLWGRPWPLRACSAGQSSSQPSSLILCLPRRIYIRPCAASLRASLPR